MVKMFISVVFALVACCTMSHASDTLRMHRDSVLIEVGGACCPARPYPQPTESLSSYDERLQAWFALCRRIERAARALRGSQGRIQ